MTTPTNFITFTKNGDARVFLDMLVPGTVYKKSGNLIEGLSLARVNERRSRNGYSTAKVPGGIPPLKDRGLFPFITLNRSELGFEIFDESAKRVPIHFGDNFSGTPDHIEIYFDPREDDLIPTMGKGAGVPVRYKVVEWDGPQLISRVPMRESDWIAICDIADRFQWTTDRAVNELITLWHVERGQ